MLRRFSYSPAAALQLQPASEFPAGHLHRRSGASSLLSSQLLRSWLQGESPEFAFQPSLSSITGQMLLVWRPPFRPLLDDSWDGWTSVTHMCRHLALKLKRPLPTQGSQGVVISKKSATTSFNMVILHYCTVPAEAKRRRRTNETNQVLIIQLSEGRRDRYKGQIRGKSLFCGHVAADACQ